MFAFSLALGVVGLIALVCIWLLVSYIIRIKSDSDEDDDDDESEMNNEDDCKKALKLEKRKRGKASKFSTFLGNGPIRKRQSDPP